MMQALELLWWQKGTSQDKAMFKCGKIKPLVVIELRLSEGISIYISK